MGGRVHHGGGVAIAIWARVHLGTNWSGMYFERGTSDPDRPIPNIRHPFIRDSDAFAGECGRKPAGARLIALAIIWASFFIKARREKVFLTQ